MSEEFKSLGERVSKLFENQQDKAEAAERFYLMGDNLIEECNGIETEITEALRKMKKISPSMYQEYIVSFAKETVEEEKE